MGRPINPLEGSLSLPGARHLIAAVTLLVATMLPVLVTRAFYLERLLDSNNLEVSDDETWVVAQLEVEYLKLRLALEDIRPDPPATDAEGVPRDRWPEVMRRFDIFYSRLGAVVSKVRLWSERSADWPDNLRLLDKLIGDRDRIAAFLDDASRPGAPIDLDALDQTLDTTAIEVRDLSVSTLSLLSKEASQRRLGYVKEFRSLLALSISMVLVMLLAGAAAWLLYRHNGVRAAAERRLSENLYRVFDAKPGAILMTDADNRITWMNLAAGELLGMLEAQAKGRDVLELFFPGAERARRQGRLHPLSATDHDVNQTFRDIVRRAGGGILAVEVTRTNLVAEGGDRIAALFVRDISQTQRALRAMRRERRMAEAEADRYQRFLAVMSHELRSPLHAIIASLDLARQRPEAAAMRDLHAIALDAARVALDEADAVLDIGKAEHGMRSAERAIFSPRDVVLDLVEMNRPAATSARTELVVDIGPGAELTVLGQRACFWHAVSNLLGNAVKFTRNGTIALRLVRTAGDLRVEVTDDGPGIAPDLQKLVFRDHFTRDPSPGRRTRGAGLGLGVFVSAVKAMSGQFGLTSQVGQGSTFWFEFPAKPEILPAPVVVHPDASRSALPFDLKVLVVDDSDINRTLILKMFLAIGMKADLAKSGADAVTLAQSRAYDLILMDLSMPGMDGFAAADAIRKRGASSAAGIFALTANVLARPEVDRQGSPFDGTLTKPLRLDELRSFLVTLAPVPPGPLNSVPTLLDPDCVRDLMEMLGASALRPLLTSLFVSARDIQHETNPGQPQPTLQAEFHRIAGSAGMLGAERLRALALKGENICQEANQRIDPLFMAAWMETVTDTEHEWNSLLHGSSGRILHGIER